MKYLALAFKIEIMILGIYMMMTATELMSAPFVSGIGFFSIGIYLGLQGIYGTNFSGCVFFPPVEAPKKKGFFG